MRSEPDGELRRRLVAALRDERSVSAAAKAAGCARSLVYKLARTDARIREALDGAQARPGKGRRRAASLPSDLPPALREKALAQLEALLDDRTLAARDRVAVLRLTLDATRPVATPAPAAPAAPSPADPLTDDEAARVEALLA